MRIMPFRAVVAPVTCAVLAAGGLAALAVTGGAAPALAAPDGCTGTTTVTCTYTSAGLDTFTVPAGVTSLDVTAVGAAGVQATALTVQAATPRAARALRSRTRLSRSPRIKARP